MIKEIHCFGTSHTEGGGFEFMHKIRNIELKKFYKEEPSYKRKLFMAWSITEINW
jgi:hypothetical protein